MNATGKRRLLKLAAFLETAKLPGRFDLTTMADAAHNGQPACGTRACALGWATTIPSFRRAGLHLSRSGGLHLKGARLTRWGEVAGRFFDISEDKAADLFAATGCLDRGMPGRRAVARSIRKLVASKAA